MPFEIHNWDDISRDFQRGTAILGNGTSIAIDENFRYQSLLNEARRRDLFTSEVEDLFETFTTSDFELVLRLVWHATKVNSSLRIPDGLTDRVYQDIRSALIQTVREIHPPHYEVMERLPSMYGFLKQFSTILSLNYDLLAYWATTYGLNIADGHAIKDCFLRDGSFDEDWWRFRNSIGERSNTLIFYPHGSLALCRDIYDDERKVHDRGTGLLDAIQEKWNSERHVPLFVSEGTAEQKHLSIQNSYYLSTVYKEVIPSLSGSLTIFGWGMGDQETHLLKRLSRSNVNRVACSVRRDNQRECGEISSKISEYFRRIEVVFFDRESTGWATLPE